MKIRATKQSTAIVRNLSSRNMITFPRIIAGLALASLGVDARQAGVGADALRSVEATTHSVYGALLVAVLVVCCVCAESGRV